jgi:acyl-CoA oxidase
MGEKLKSLEGSTLGMISNTNELKEIAALSAGLKALCTIIASEGMEECRKCCGGNGYLLSSGIA